MFNIFTLLASIYVHTMAGGMPVYIGMPNPNTGIYEPAGPGGPPPPPPPPPPKEKEN